jgi:hypothetical protein
VSTPQPPENVIDGLFATVEKDGRVRFDMARRKKSIAHVTLPAAEAAEIAAQALGGAYDAFDQAMLGLVPEGERKASYPFVRITGLGLGPCPLEDHTCLVVRVGATEIGFAFPKDKLKEFGKWLATAELPG